MNDDMQNIYINLDDSGKLSEKEKVAIYGGIVFLDKKEKDKFITQYRSIVNNLKCKYCHKSCLLGNCPELKHSNLKNSDRRRIINYIKKYTVVACIINNEKVYNHIISNKASRGRYCDYALRRTIKEIIIGLIKERRIDPYKPIKIILNIDEQTTKSNGYYNLKEGLIEELKYGITNFNYGANYEPIVFSDLDIILSYQKSDKSFAVQAADLVAGTVRRRVLISYESMIDLNNYISFVNYKVFLP